MRSGSCRKILHYTLLFGHATEHKFVMVSLFTLKFQRSSAARPNACKHLERVTGAHSAKRLEAPMIIYEFCFSHSIDSVDEGIKVQLSCYRRV